MKKRATETNPFMASLIGPIKLVGLYSCRFGRVFGQRDAFRFHVAASRFQLGKKSLPRPDRASANQNAAQPETPPAVK
jgi:hypothetical protein